MSKSESRNPQLRYLITCSRVNVIDAETATVVTTLAAENTFELGFSPLGTYIITWQRPSKDETTGDAVKNLKVWRVAEDTTDTEKETIGRFVQKSQTGWNLQYTFDEKFCARVVTNEVQIYESHDLTKVWNKLRVEGVSDFAVSPGENHSIAVFVPERKVSHQAGSKETKELTEIGTTSRRPSLQCSELHHTSLAEELLQGRQGATQMERCGHYIDRPGADRGRQDRKELLWRNNHVLVERKRCFRLTNRP